MSKARWLIGLIGAGVLASPAWAGDVEGTVSISGKVKEFKKGQVKQKAGYEQHYNPSEHLPTKNELDNVVVMLEGPDLRCTPKTSKGTDNTIRQRDYQFWPHVVVVPKGSKVYFQNQDAFIHRVYSVSEPHQFDFKGFKSERNEPFDKGGEVEIFCGIHTGMNAYIIVTDNDFYAKADETGHYTIRGVPPGTYKLKIWHPRLDAVEKSITVPKSGVAKQDASL